MKEIEQELPNPGAVLHAQREKLGLPLSMVADRLAMTKTAVRDLEENRYEAFPAGIYVRGYLKNFCKQLELPEEQVLSLYEARVAQQSSNTSKEAEREARAARSAIVYKSAIAVVVVLTAAWLVYFFG